MYTEVKDEGNKPCVECVFANECYGRCRAKNGYHWEER